LAANILLVLSCRRVVYADDHHLIDRPSEPAPKEVATAGDHGDLTRSSLKMPGELVQREEAKRAQRTG